MKKIISILLFKKTCTTGKKYMDKKNPPKTKCAHHVYFNNKIGE